MAILRMLLSCCSSVHARDHKGQTPLHYACRKKSVYPSSHVLSRKTGEHILLLLEHGAEVMDLDNSGMTSYHVAVQEDYSVAVEVLIQKHGTSWIESTNSYGQSALHLAAETGARSVLQTLWTHAGQDSMMRTDLDGNTPLHYAAKAGMEDIVNILVTMMGSDIEVKNQHGFKAIDLAIKHRHWSTASLLRRPKQAQMQPQGKLHIIQKGYLLALIVLTINIAWSQWGNDLKSVILGFWVH
jgi:ankyrin repeat protein